MNTDSIISGGLTKAWGLREAPSGMNLDFVNADFTEGYSLKRGRHGVRDLRDVILEVALAVHQSPKFKRVVVLLLAGRVSASRVRQEWKQACEVLLPSVRQRMALIALVDGKLVTEPAMPDLALMGETLKSLTLSDAPVPGTWARLDAHVKSIDAIDSEESLPRTASGAVTWRGMEIEKILVRRWMLKEEPIHRKVLAQQVGCSMPTLTGYLQRLKGEGLLARGRSVALKMYPRERWEELQRMWTLMDEPVRFWDPTGEGTVEGLLAQMKRRMPDGVAVGGVVAARWWDPHFNLNGTPRLDLVVHAPEARGRSQTADLGFVRRLDPALRLQGAGGEARGQAALLVVHRLRRNKAMFTKAAGEVMEIADPVETILELQDMGLTAQAGELLARLRPEETIA